LTSKRKKKEKKKSTKDDENDDFELLNAFSLEQLRKESRSCGLEATGTKKQLKERLVSHLKKQHTQLKELQEKSKTGTGGCTCSGIRNCEYCVATLIEGLML